MPFNIATIENYLIRTLNFFFSILITLPNCSIALITVSDVVKRVAIKSFPRRRSLPPQLCSVTARHICTRETYPSVQKLLYR